MMASSGPRGMVLCALSLTLCLMLCDGQANLKGNYMYVWTGDLATGAKDYVVTVDLVPGSATYGQMIDKAYIPFGGTEAHHINVVSDGTALAAGALFDFFFQYPSIYLFDLANPAKPVYTGCVNSSAGGADDLQPLPDGGFLVTMMGSKDGGSPGKISRYSRDLQLMTEFGPNDPTFNPHGIGISAKHGRFVTTDFFEPKTAAIGSDIAFRKTVRLWDLKTFEVLKTFDHNSATIMDTRILGDRPFAIFGNGDGNVFVMHLQTQEFKRVYNLSDSFKGPLPGMYRVYNSGTRVIVTVWEPAALLLLNFDNPWEPKLLDSYLFDAAANPHALEITTDKYGLLLTVASYFVARPEITQLDLHGDRKVRFLTIANDKFMDHPELQPLDFNLLAGNPHGVTFKRLDNAPLRG